jgi:1,4-alpha-glucan branching enzyme
MSVQPTVDGDGSVVATFRLPAQVHATTVHVVGEFNDWSPSAHPMESGGQGFIARVPLQPGRRYRFRYLIDGERWENDWAADDYIDNDFGGTDSVLDLTGAARPELVTEAMS